MIDRLVIDVIFRALGSLFVSSRRAPLRAAGGRPRPRAVIVSADEMSGRAREYEAWAATHGLEVVGTEPPDAHGAHFRGARCGREVELTTGLGAFGPPTSPELLVWTDLIPTESSLRLEPNTGTAQPGSTTPWARELSAVLAVEGVRDLDVTRRFVRVRFDAFAPPKVVDRGWSALDEALAAITNAAPAASAYR